MSRRKIHEHPFIYDHIQKETHMIRQMLELTEHHRMHCPEYGAMLQSMGYDRNQVNGYEDLPFLPVTLFKKMTLSSLPAEEEQNVKVITSSGTSGQNRSQIVLDGDTRQLQQQVLASIGSDFLGPKRMPMLVIDCPATVKKRNHYSARTAGILGFSLFGGARTYALRDEDMSLDLEAVQGFLQRYGDQPFLIYGFTFLIWQHLVQAAESKGLDLSQGILVHGGGWKKLQDQAVSKEAFRKRLGELYGIRRVMDYYGMAEQAGSIFMECECGHLHCSDYSAVLMRRARDYSLCDRGEKGLIQVMSLVPESYPGHSLLTEDEGRILGEDDCPCGRKGVYFEVLGRVRQAELRGCSDTYAAEWSRQEHDARMQWLIGSEQELMHLEEQSRQGVPMGWMPFSEVTKGFLMAISERLRKNPVVRKEMPDVMGYAFWCRQAHLEEMQREYPDVVKHRRGRSVSLHFAASNLPVLFAFSLTAGLLAGNCCIVRMPSRESIQERVILQTLKEVMEQEFPQLIGRILICRYPHDASINARLSKLCDGRILWGSDTSIREIQQGKLKPGAVDLPFGNRYSAALFHGKTVAETPDLDLLVKDFYNDTYLNDQNACSSPRVIYWLGTEAECESARNRFWKELQKLLDQRQYEVSEMMAVKKTDAADQMAVFFKEKQVQIEQMGDNRICRVKMGSLDRDIWKYTVSGGLFVECCGRDAEELWQILPEEFQTLTWFGVEPDTQPARIRRMVPVGHGLDFTLNWDGQSLMEALTIKIA